MNVLIGKIDNRGIAMEVVRGERKPPLDVIEVERAHFLLLGREPDNGIAEKCKRAIRPIIAQWGGDGNKLRSNINDINPEVCTLPDVFQHIAPTDNQAVASLKPIVIVVKIKRTMSLITECMAKIPL